MSDSDLRELERRWRESGSVEDEARYLLGRVRGAELEPERLELAAYCGHAAARAAAVALPGARDELEVIEKLPGILNALYSTRESMFEFLAALTRHLLKLEVDPEIVNLATSALRAGRQYLLSPTAGTARECARHVPTAFELHLEAASPSAEVAWLTWVVARVASNGWEEDLWRHGACNELSAFLTHHESQLSQAGFELGESLLRTR